MGFMLGHVLEKKNRELGHVLETAVNAAAYRDKQQMCPFVRVRTFPTVIPVKPPAFEPILWKLVWS